MESSATSSVVGPSLAPSTVMAATRSVTPGVSAFHDANNYEIWDPLNWMLDGLVDLPSFSIPGVQELEAHEGLS